MSRLGKIPVEIPDGVKLSYRDGVLTAEGPKGKMSQPLHPEMAIKIDAAAKKVVVTRPSEARKHLELHGLTRSLIAGAIKGVHLGYEKKLEVIGVGYTAKVTGKTLAMTLGFSHPIAMQIPDGLTVKTPTQTMIEVSGVDKRLVGQFAADVRFNRPCEPYNSKGVKYTDEVVRRKAGKTFVTGA
ncbi:MAG: 50S ribosomal protein L6 [Planctomycetes bacterium]|nr:50S ribosomal protein L6 [Planctomycetota bacterium]